MRKTLSILTASFTQDIHRFWLWFPVSMACGIATYFGLFSEPSLYLGSLVLSILVSIWFVFRRSTYIVFAVLLPLGFAVGFTAAQVRTALVEAPKITQDLSARPFKGEVISYQETDKGPRLVMQPTYIQDVPENALPEKIKVVINKQAAGETFVPGDIIRVWGFLKPPLGLAYKGAYDFERQNYFNQIGGVGFALSKPQLLERPTGLKWSHQVETIRSVVTDKIYGALPGETGGIAAALITGHKEKIPEATYEAYRNAGLAHLLAISGLHFGLIFGFIFFTIRFLLVLIPGFALRYPIKKWAILVALLGAFCYSVLAGGSVPTLRSFIMLGLFSWAVLLDRLALSMYNVAWAAVIIMLIMPEALLGASFQMSFAAVIALIALYEKGMGEERNKTRGYLWRTIMYIFVLAGTSLIAGFATMPYTIFHFGQFQPYGVAANLMAIPLTGVWIMPIALLALVMMPIGLETWPLKLMGAGVDIVTWVAKAVASWDGSVILAPQFNALEMAFITLGALWCMIWQQKWRYLGIAPILVGFVMLVTHDRPDLFIGQKGKMLAVRTAEGLYVTTVKRQAFTRKQWMVMAGCTEESCFPYSNKKRDDRYAGEKLLNCDYLGCVAKLDGKLVAIPRREEAMYKDCAQADMILISGQQKNLCPEKTVETPSFDAGLGYVEEGGIRWVMPEKAKRPWR